MELCYIQKYALVKVTYGCLHLQVNKAVLAHCRCDNVSLPGYRTNCHSTAGHRPQCNKIQAVNIISQFMILSILEQQLKTFSKYSDCATNRTELGWNPGKCEIFLFSETSIPVLGPTSVPSREQSGLGMELTNNLQLLAWLRTSGALLLIPLQAFILCTWKT